MIRLGVNIDHVATLRQARGITEPDPIYAAAIVELAGADGITIHLREDRRHIQDRDLKILRQTVKSILNLEMAATEEIVNIALDVKPDQVTLVPEKREELTTEGGLDVISNFDKIKAAVERLKAGNIRVSLFIDPDVKQIKASSKTNADAIEIHTGEYANATTEDEAERNLSGIIQAAKFAKKLNLAVHAGHGLNYRNVQPIAAIEEIEELNIGHSMISYAVFVGLEKAVREMKQLMLEARK